MRTKVILSQQIASAIITAGQEEAQKNNWFVSITTTDGGGYLLVPSRMDNCAPVAAYISQERAHAAVLECRETKGYEEMVDNGCTVSVTAPLLASLEGSVPAVVDGQIIGIVGVSGLTGTRDAQVAKAAAAVLAKQAKTRKETMSQTITQSRLHTNADFKRSADGEVLSGTGLDAMAFWRNFDEIVRDLTPKNRQLLAERDCIQATPDE